MRAKRLGRPPDTTSDATRERVLLAARDCFSNFGYSKTTNKDIADAAGITTGAIYHYFDSKPALFGAVASEVSNLVFEQFQTAAGEHEHFVDRLRAVLDTASRLHSEDPSLARFSAIFPIELSRHPELQDNLSAADIGRSSQFFRRLAKEARVAGELPDDLTTADVANMLVAVTLGLAYFGTLVDSTSVHRGAVVVVEKLFEHGFAAPVAAAD